MRVVECDDGRRSVVGRLISLFTSISVQSKEGIRPSKWKLATETTQGDLPLEVAQHLAIYFTGQSESLSTKTVNVGSAFTDNSAASLGAITLESNVDYTLSITSDNGLKVKRTSTVVDVWTMAYMLSLADGGGGSLSMTSSPFQSTAQSWDASGYAEWGMTLTPAETSAAKRSGTYRDILTISVSPDGAL